LTASRININPKRLSDGHVADAKLVKVFGEAFDGFLAGAHKRDRSNSDGIVAQEVDVKEVANVLWHFVVDQTRHLLGVFDGIIHSLQHQVGHKDLRKEGDHQRFDHDRVGGNEGERESQKRAKRGEKETFLDVAVACSFKTWRT